jgi:hypothetical protein
MKILETELAIRSHRALSSLGHSQTCTPFPIWRSGANKRMTGKRRLSIYSFSSANRLRRHLRHLVLEFQEKKKRVVNGRRHGEIFPTVDALLWGWL